jgi:hypothetical protein
MASFGERFNQWRIGQGKEQLPPEQIVALDEAAADTKVWLTENQDTIVKQMQRLGQFLSDLARGDTDA